VAPRLAFPAAQRDELNLSRRPWDIFSGCTVPQGIERQAAVSAQEMLPWGRKRRLDVERCAASQKKAVIPDGKKNNNE